MLCQGPELFLNSFTIILEVKNCLFSTAEELFKMKRAIRFVSRFGNNDKNDSYKD